MTVTAFNEFHLPEAFLDALEQRGFTEPTPVQAQVLSQPHLDVDLVVQARTGSGKTLAFILPLAGTLSEGEKTPRILILSPTRELAMQNAGEAEFFGKIKGLQTAVLVGGMNMEQQIARLKGGAALIVGTPGRILDHVKRHTLDLSSVETVVLDEGDDMLDMGFREELEAILDAASNRKKTWLFSATMPDAVFELSKRYLSNPVHLELNHEDEQHADIEHRAYLVPSHRRLEALVNVLLWEHPARCLVFCHTKTDTGEVTGRLQKEGFMALALNGDMTQRERNVALESFRSGRIPILVATNVAARGLDVQGVTHVIQLGLPETMETFVHRSGRTGRAGQEGSNLLLLTPGESSRFKGMIHRSEMKVQWLKVPDLKEIGVIQRELREESLLSLTPSDETFQWADSLLEQSGDARQLTAKLLTAIVKDMPTGYTLRDVLQRELDSRRAGIDPRRNKSLKLRREKEGDRGALRGGFRTSGPVYKLRLVKGRNTPEWSVVRILGALCTALNVDRNEIGNIKLRDTYSEVELSASAAANLDDGGRERLIDRGLLRDGAGKLVLSGPRRERRFSRSGERLAAQRTERSGGLKFRRRTAESR